jgi:hypothetical protein
MQKKLNETFIESYSEEFSKEVVSAYFEDRHSISGKEILNLSPSRQVNMFVLMILFRKWQDEMKSLESPYFDYKNTEVRKAMVQFMNVLSQHITVGASDLKPLLEQATRQSILLAADPVAYIKEEFAEVEGTAVTEKLVQPVLKYIKLHKEDIQGFMRINIPASKEEFIEAAEDYFEVYDGVEVLAEELQKLSEIHPITEEDVFEGKVKEEEEFPSFESEEDEETSSEDISFFDQDLDEEEPEENELMEEEIEEDEPETEELEDEPEPSRPQANVITEDLDDEDIEIDDEDIELIEFGDEESEPEEEPESAPVAKASVDIPEEKEEEPEEGTVNSKFSRPSNTLNETFESKEEETVGDQLEKRKVNTIMDAISVNNRYMFTKELFDGDRDTFVSAIQELEAMESFDDAVEKLIHSYAKTFKWDMNSPEVKELLKVVFRRFR